MVDETKDGKSSGNGAADRVTPAIMAEMNVLASRMASMDTVAIYARTILVAGATAIILGAITGQNLGLLFLVVPVIAAQLVTEGRVRQFYEPMSQRLDTISVECFGVNKPLNERINAMAWHAEGGTWPQRKYLCHREQLFWAGAVGIVTVLIPIVMNFTALISLVRYWFK